VREVGLGMNEWASVDKVIDGEERKDEKEKLVGMGACYSPI
jgi:hypothetical protein